MQFYKKTKSFVPTFLFVSFLLNTLCIVACDESQELTPTLGSPDSGLSPGVGGFTPYTGDVGIVHENLEFDESPQVELPAVVTASDNNEYACKNSLSALPTGNIEYSDLVATVSHEIIPGTLKVQWKEPASTETPASEDVADEVQLVISLDDENFERIYTSQLSSKIDISDSLAASRVAMLLTHNFHFFAEETGVVGTFEITFDNGQGMLGEFCQFL
jgi:hypothetical protein